MKQTLPAAAAVLALALGACSSDTVPTEPADDPVASSTNSSTNPTATPALESADAAPDGLDYQVCWTAPHSDGTDTVSFSEATDEWSLIDPLTGMHAHAAAFGDVNGDDRIDLFVGTFANRAVDKYAVRGAEGPAPDRVLFGTDGGFEVAPFPEHFGRTSGAVFADLDNDGDDDLVASRNYKDGERGDLATLVYENVGGWWEVVDGSGLPVEFGGRSVGVLDFDHDGWLDLFIVEDRYVGGSSRLLRNEGGLRFVDATGQAGLPDDIHGLGLAVGDVTGDAWSDFFVGGSNRLFVSDGSGGFVEQDGPFEWETYGPEDDVAGAAFGDVNRDGQLDLVVGHHFNSTVSRDASAPVRLYLNAGGGEFEDVTEAAGLVGLPTKAPHVEFVDFDNDGWLDILTSASAVDGSQPAIFMNRGAAEPSFDAPSGLGSDQYWVTAPTADINRDGRLDVLLVEWEPSLPSLLMMNQSASGSWLEVAAPVGARVEVFEQGHLADMSRLLGAAEVSVSQGYTAGNERVVHFGLGEHALVDVRVAVQGAAAKDLLDVGVDRRIAVASGC